MTNTFKYSRKLLSWENLGSFGYKDGSESQSREVRYFGVA